MQSLSKTILNQKINSSYSMYVVPNICVETCYEPKDNRNVTGGCVMLPFHHILPKQVPTKAYPVSPATLQTHAQHL